MTTDTKNAQASFRIRPEDEVMMAEVEQVAKKIDRTIADTIRRLMKLGIKAYKNGAEL